LSALAGQIAAVHRGHGHGEALVRAFRRAAVLVPLAAGDLPISAVHGGVRWIYAFTGEAELAAFAEARRDVPGDYATIRGARLLDAVVPQQDGPTGVALDVAGAYPMMLPPVVGIVPAAVAVNVDGGT
jgi:hypothetical protein